MAAAVAVGLKKTDQAIPTKALIRLLTNLLRLLPAMAQIHMLNVSLMAFTLIGPYRPLLTNADRWWLSKLRCSLVPITDVPATTTGRTSDSSLWGPSRRCSPPWSPVILVDCEQPRAFVTGRDLDTGRWPNKFAD